MMMMTLVLWRVECYCLYDDGWYHTDGGVCGNDYGVKQ